VSNRDFYEAATINVAAFLLLKNLTAVTSRQQTEKFRNKGIH
jgi:hypothetical protein